MFRRRHRSVPSPIDVGADRRAAIEVIDDDNFEARTAGRPTVVDLWAPWCGPCRSFRPIFEAAAASAGDRVRFASCNVDESPETAVLLQVQSIPTVVGFGADGSEVGRLVGVPSRSRFEAFVAEVASHHHHHHDHQPSA